MAGPQQTSLASRLLHKLQVLERGDAAEGADLAKALEKLAEAHGAFQTEPGLVRWTLEDIPQPVEAAYLFMAGALGAEDFASAVNTSTWAQIGMRMVQAYSHQPRSGPREIMDY